MAHPLVHALIFAAAVLIPGGLLVYFAWLAYKRRRDRKAAPPKLEEIREAFFKMYPKDSLRAQSRRDRLDRIMRFRHRKSKK